MSIARPGDCVIAFAIPLSEKDFLSLERQPHSEYVRKFAAGAWAQYREIGEHLQGNIAAYRACGVGRVVERLSLDDWTSLFSGSSVVILFAHSIEAAGTTEGTIELWDCRASPDDLVRRIPLGFQGVIDLSVCHAWVLSAEIERARENVASPYLPFEAHPLIWSQIYVSVLQTLARFDLSYIEAHEKVVCEYRRQSARRLVMSSREVIRLYLKQIGQLPLSETSPEAMGGPAARETMASDTRFLQDLVLQQSKTNRLVLAFGLFLILVVLVFTLVGASRAGCSSSVVLSAAGIGVGAEVGLLAWVSRLWREYNRFSLLLLLCRSSSLKPTDVTKVLGVLYFNETGRKKRLKE